MLPALIDQSLLTRSNVAVETKLLVSRFSSYSRIWVYQKMGSPSKPWSMSNRALTPSPAPMAIMAGVMRKEKKSASPLPVPLMVMCGTVVASAISGLLFKPQLAKSRGWAV